MKLRELIEILNKVEDKELEVLVSGYEAGYNPLLPKQIGIKQVYQGISDDDRRWYKGLYEDIDELEEEDKLKPFFKQFKAIIVH